MTCIFTQAEIVTFIGKTVDLDDKSAIDSLFELIVDGVQHK